MNKKTIRILLIIAIGIWMITVFKFSHEPAVESTKTSGQIIKKIINIFPYTKHLDQQQKDLLTKQLQPIARKLAHFSIYMLAGILVMSFVNTYFIILRKKLMISLNFGVIYAISDEFHQSFIPGRSCEIRDMLIDSFGTLLGIIFVIICSRIYQKIKIKKKGA